ncbi:AsmA family protein [Candidatus Trichorickettsia mobilis]|uniref:AsmA family protein n=1 Tax=Candidatus Trichorickettsia mobilis TaxID=1346319 RepID=A0ABZ0URA5_9RICK|nr:AsmA family protein [Candidatus Trichorickettsia mobilis]WPY00574.1 AsmA family protein [Candidatus Trichorickettsia mobilis]
MKKLKYFGLTLLVLVIILLLAPKLFSLNNYKEFIAKKVKDAIGRDLLIQGDISLDILPIPTLKVENVTLSSFVGAQEPAFIAIKTAKVALSPTSLFTKQIIISSIDLINPIISLEKSADGKNNSWEFSSNKPSLVKEDSATSQGTATPFTVKLIKISQGQVQYLDKKAKTTVSNIDIDANISSFKGPIDFTSTFEIFEKKLDLKGKIDSLTDIIALMVELKVLDKKIILKGEIDAKDFSFKGDISSDGDLKNISSIVPNLTLPAGLAQEYKLEATIQTNRDAITIKPINLTVGAIQVSGEGNYSVKQVEANLLLDVQPGQISFKIEPVAQAQKVSGTFISKIYAEAKAPQLFIAALKIPSVQSSQFLNQAISLSAMLNYKEQNALIQDIVVDIAKTKVKGKIGVQDWSSKPLLSYDLKTDDALALAQLFGINLPLSPGSVQISGETIKYKDKELINTNTAVTLAQMTSAIKGDIACGQSAKSNLEVKLAGDNLTKTLQLLLHNNFNSSLKAFSFSGLMQGDLSKDIKIKFNSSIVANNETMTMIGDSSINLIKNLPNIVLNLETSAINLDYFLPSGTPSNIGSNAAAQRKVEPNKRWAEDKIDLSFLGKFNADCNLAIKKIIRGSFTFDNIKAKMKLADNAANLVSLTGSLYGGQLSSNGSISAVGNQPFSLNASIKEARLKDITPDYQRFKVVQGTFNLDTALKSTGVSQAQYINNLSGNINFDGINGRLNGINLQQVVDSLNNIKNIETVFGSLNNAFTSGETVFKKLEGSTAIKDGIAQITKLNVEIPGASATALGQINLPQYSLDVNSTITVDIKNMPAFQVHLYGALDSIQHKIDLDSLKKYIIQNVLGDVMKNVKPKNLLKNLIGGEKQRNDQEPPAQPTGQVEENPDSNLSPKKPLENLIKKGLNKILQ